MAALITSLFLLAFPFPLTFGSSRRRLSEFIRHYEPLDYVPEPSLAKRSTRRIPESVCLDIEAFRRKLILDLRRDLVTLASDAQIVDENNKWISFDRHTFVVGRLKGQNRSKVHGVLTNSGVFIGKIYSEQDIYFVESAKRYFKNQTTFHSVIYRDRDVHYNVNIATPGKATQGIFHRFAGVQSVRTRRSFTNYDRNICRLSLEADHTFLEMAEGTSHAVQMLVSHVQGLNYIFGKELNTTATFAPHGIRFQIARIRIYFSMTDNYIPKQLGRENLDASTFLSLVAEGDYTEYCQAVFFTHRSFTGGTLGVAYIKGACTWNDGQSSNTAVVTFRREDTTLPPKVTEITLAHEVGHAFGAEHDPDTSECFPEGKDGNFIMAATATSGDRHNNVHFSPCSLRQMKKFIENVRSKPLRGQRYCLETLQSIENMGDLCGNGVVDNGVHIISKYREECDCGNEYKCRESEPGNCCNPRTCKLNRPHAECSGSNGRCCNVTTCRYKEAGEECMPETECSQAARCSGNTSQCPAQPHKRNFLECNKDSNLCMNGTCSLSVCVKLGLEACFCSEKESQCKICCLYEGKCQAAKDIAKFQSKIKTVYLSPGSICADNKGYCDMFHYCHKIDMEGPLLRLYQLYFTKEGVKEITHRFWWAILLGTVGWIGCIVLLIKYGALYTTSSNPVLNQTKPARKPFWKKSSRPKNAEQIEMITD